MKELKKKKLIDSALEARCCSETSKYFSRLQSRIYQFLAYRFLQDYWVSAFCPSFEILNDEKKTKNTELRGLSPRENYTGRATIACRRS
jgi:hypothetical protein